MASLLQSLDWSTPVRRRDDRALAPVANEVYLQIFDYFEPGPSFTLAECRTVLASLSAVCRFFAVACIPRLYTDICLECKPPTPTRAGTALVEWVHEITRGDTAAMAAAQHVQKLTLTMWMRSRGTRPVATESGLVNFRNLRSLILDYTPLTEGMLKAMAEMPSLVRLQMKTCSVVGIPGNLSSLKLQELSVLQDHLAVHSDLSDAYIRFFASSPALRSFECTNAELSKAFLQQNNPEFSLETLRVPLVAREAVVEDLGRFLSLQSLQTLDFIYGRASLPSSFSNASQALSKLKHVQAPLWNLKPLLAATLVGSVDLTAGFVYNQLGERLTVPSHEDFRSAGHTGLTEMLSDMQDRFVAVTELVVENELLQAIPILKACTSLEYLHVIQLKGSDDRYRHRHYPSNEDVEELCNHLHATCPPSLRRLRVDLGSHPSEGDSISEDVNLEQQHAWVTRLASSVPTLSAIRLCRYFAWERRNSSWSPFVTDKDSAKAMITKKRFHGDLIDWDGCIRWLFEDEDPRWVASLCTL